MMRAARRGGHSLPAVDWWVRDGTWEQDLRELKCELLSTRRSLLGRGQGRAGPTWEAGGTSVRGWGQTGTLGLGRPRAFPLSWRIPTGDQKGQVKGPPGLGGGNGVPGVLGRSSSLWQGV